MLLFSSKVRSYQQRIHKKPIDVIENKIDFQPRTNSRRAFMRPPKTQATGALARCSSINFSDRSQASLNHSWNPSCSTSMIHKESKELPIYMPYEKTLYDIKFERDHQNDLRQKYNIPSPFERKWLRQPRYIPQERPQFNQLEQQKQH